MSHKMGNYLTAKMGWLKVLGQTWDLKIIRAGLHSDNFSWTGVPQ